MIERLYISEMRWDLKESCFFKHELKVGDAIWFLPSISFDHFEESDAKTYSFVHVIHDVYEFHFKVTERFFNDLNTNCFHYLIETMPGFALFHFNWGKEYGKYLQAGKWYRGFGRVSGNGDPAESNPFVDPVAIKDIIRKGIIERIVVVHNNREYIESIPPDFDEVFTFEDPLEKLGYPKDYGRFKDSLPGYSPKIKELESTAQKDVYDDLVFSMRIK